MRELPDLSDRVAVVATDGDRARTLFEPAARASSACDGRDLVPERVDPSRAGSLATDGVLNLLEHGATALFDLEQLPSGAFALASWLARSRGRAVVLVRAASGAIPYEVRDLPVRVADAALEGGAPRTRTALSQLLTEAAVARARLGDEDAALADLRRSCARRRRRVRSGVAEALRRADRAVLAGTPDRALEPMAWAREQEPDAADLLVREAVLLRDLGREEEAIARLERATLRAPECAPAWRELGAARDALTAEGAEEALRRAVALDGDYGALVTLAPVLERSGRTTEALQILERALEACDGQLNLVIPTLVLRAARDAQVAPTELQRERLEQVLRIRRRQAESEPPVDAPWSAFDAATACWLLGRCDEAAGLVKDVAGSLTAPWQAETFGRTVDALERAKVDVAAARAALGIKPRGATTAAAAPTAPSAPRAPGKPMRAEARDAAFARANVPCASACPVGTDAGGYVMLLARGDLDGAYRVARGPNPFASVCGRICAAPCETACRRGAVDEPVAIRPLKRFLSERHGPESDDSRLEHVLDGTRAPGMEGPAYTSHLQRLGRAAGGGRRVAVVGGGPAGLACAHDLALLGHRVTVFEASESLGGMMRHGIPEFRLPRDVLDREIDAIVRLGVEVSLKAPLGEGRTVDDLFRGGYEAVFLGSGAGRGRDLEVEGSDLDGVVRAIDFLINVNNGFRMGLGTRVLVVGGGNVAMDVSRTLLRLGRVERARAAATSRTIAPALRGEALLAAVEGAAAEVHVVARQPLGQWPAQKGVHGREEVEEARKEGVRFHPLRGVRRIVGEGGRVAAVELAEVVRLVDERGRYAPLYGPHAAETIPCDAVLLAVGQEPDLDWLAGTAGLERTRDGLVRVDPATLSTSRPGVYAGGDVAFGPRTLIEAVAEGKRAAAGIHRFLAGDRPLPVRHEYDEVHPRSTWADEHYDALPRVEPPTIGIDRRTGIGEVEGGYDEAEARRQAARCLSCHVQTVYDGGLCIACGRCVEVCPWRCLGFSPVGDVEGTDAATSALLTGAPQGALAMVKDETACVRCGLCAERCPTGAMTMQRYDLVAQGPSA